MRQMKSATGGGGLAWSDSSDCREKTPPIQQCRFTYCLPEDDGRKTWRSRSKEDLEEMTETDGNFLSPDAPGGTGGSKKVSK